MAAQNTAHRPFSSLIGTTWDALYQKGMRIAVSYCRNRSDAEDIAHWALMKLDEELNSGKLIRNYEGWLNSAIYHQFISQTKRQRKGIQVDECTIEKIYTAEEPLAIHEIDPRMAAEELTNFMRIKKFDQISMKYLIAQSILHEGMSWRPRSASKQLAAELLGEKQSYLDQRLRSFIGDPAKCRRQEDEFFEHFYRRNIDPQMFFTAVKDYRFLMWCPSMADIIADLIAGLMSIFQNLTKHHRINNILSALSDRNNNFDVRLMQFTSYLDLLYTSAWIPGKYVVMGGALHFHKIRNRREEFNFELLTDEVRTEELFMEFATAKHGAPAASAERWLAITVLVCLFGELSNQVDRNHLEENLLQIEQAADWGYHRTRSAIASAWISAFREPLSSAMMEDKFIKRLDPKHWYVGLALLPLCFISHDMGRGREVVRERLNDRQLWSYILMALNSESLTTVLGSLVHLSHMPYCPPPTEIRADFINALTRLQFSKSTTVQMWLTRINKRYWRLARKEPAGT